MYMLNYMGNNICCYCVIQKKLGMTAELQKQSAATN